MVRDRQRYLIYDGDCGFCDACVRIATAYDRRKLFILCPYQSLPQRLSPTELESLGLTMADCQNALQVITANGQVRSGARAINYFLWQRRPGKFLVGLLMAIPPLLLLEMVFYRIVARYRHQLSSCLGLHVCAHRDPSRKSPETWEQIDQPIREREMPAALRDR